MSTFLETAQRIATKAHEGQYRRGGVRPYIVHPEAVVARVNSPEEKATAWLHDVLEDTDTTEAELAANGIPETVIEAVSQLTKKAGIPYTDYLAEIRSNPLARTVKIADMLSNLADSPTEKQIIKYARGLLILHGEEPG